MTPSPPGISGLLHGKDLLDSADLRLLAWLCERAGPADPEDAEALALVVAALCRACSGGSLCVSLRKEDLEGDLRSLLSAVEPPEGTGTAAAAAARFLSLLESGRLEAIAAAPDAPGGLRPLVLARGNLYLHRFWFAEETVGEGLARLLRADAPDAPDVDAVLRETLEGNSLRLPGGGPLPLTDRQREALAAALRAPVFVLTGGPGTGKTTWTAAWLRAVLRLPGASPDRVRLCAPTGRAARRLEESLRAVLAGCEDDARDLAARAMTVSTLHTLLGWRAFDGTFARDAGDPLDADWVLVDEASMADVFLMAALVRALKPGTRLVLAGDPDQLPAVEAGSVLAELAPRFPGDPRAGAPEGLPPAVMLDASHRARGPLLRLSDRIRAGDADGALAALGEPVEARAAFLPERPLSRVEPSAGNADGDGPLREILRAYAAAAFPSSSRDGEPGYAEILSRFRALAREEEPAFLDALWRHAGRARVLAPLRRGAASAERANRVLRELLEPEWREARDRAGGAGFHGAPVLVTRNEARTGLSNGDLGLWLECEDGPHAFFPRPAMPGGWLRLPVALLPSCEPGFASTVHKAQGSECDEVLVILPEPGNHLLARETLYTAVTRARGRVRLFGPEASVREAIAGRLVRRGGLRSRFASPT